MSEKIEFNFTYYAMKLLGKNLYSSPWTAISEIVANGIDAKAKNVYVYVNMSNKDHAVVEIFDDGKGMDVSDLRTKYTLIGRNRRAEDNDKGKTLGRKGIGKLAALYLSPVYIISSKCNSKRTTWEVDTKKFKDSDIPTLDQISNDIGFDTQLFWDKCLSGTMIRLSDVNLHSIGGEKIKRLSAILSDYYLSSVIDCQIHVCVIESAKAQICFHPINKRIYYETMYSLFDNRQNPQKLLQAVYLTSADDYDVVNYPRHTVELPNDDYECNGTIELEDLNGNNRRLQYSLSGWIGIHVSLTKDILLRNITDDKEKSNYVLRPNGIRLYVRGKLAVENLMNYVKSNQAFANYIEGEISFDILDDDEFEDSSTSNREGYTLSDPRVKKLIEIVGKICSSLIQERSKIGTRINNEREKYLNDIVEEQRQLREKAEKDRDQAKKQLEQTSFDLGSERRRNTFLKESLSEDQVSFSKRLHMVKINNSTIKNTIKGLIEQKKRNLLTLDTAWKGIQNISYCNERIKAVLEYFASAEFDPKDESVYGDMFAFICEYCQKIVHSTFFEDDLSIDVITRCDGMYERKFVPQNIAVIIDNVISNSMKNNAKKLVISMRGDKSNYYIDIIDDGDGLNENANLNDLFEFGKSYTRHGTGVGLYHIRQIIVEMGGTISVNPEYKKGFELNVRFKYEQ